EVVVPRRSVRLSRRERGFIAALVCVTVATGMGILLTAMSNEPQATAAAEVGHRVVPLFEPVPAAQRTPASAPAMEAPDDAGRWSAGSDPASGPQQVPKSDFIVRALLWGLL